LKIEFAIDTTLEDELITMQANQKNETIQQIIKILKIPIYI